MTFAEAIKEATSKLMNTYPNMHIFGLGASYPNGLDGTMGNIAVEHPERVHDTPCSEAAVTGMAMGAAISGIRSLVHHGRVEFALFAADPLLTQAAKWAYSFGNYPVPLTVRIALGRQWGNGPQHTINAKGLFAVPGLKVVCPSTPQAAYGLLLSAVEDNNPVIYLEPRWAYKLKEYIVDSRMSLDRARVMKSGKDITVVAVGDTVIDVLKAAEMLKEFVDVEVVDLVSVYPIDRTTIIDSIRNTRRLLVCESSTYEYSTASQILSIVGSVAGIGSAGILACQDYACPTAPSLTKDYYPTPKSIANKILIMCGRSHRIENEETFAQLNLPPTDNVTDLLYRLK